MVFVPLRGIVVIYEIGMAEQIKNLIAVFVPLRGIVVIYEEDRVRRLHQQRQFSSPYGE